MLELGRSEEISVNEVRGKLVDTQKILSAAATLKIDRTKFLKLVASAGKTDRLVVKVDSSSVDLFELLKAVKLARGPEEVDWDQVALKIGIPDSSACRGEVARMIFQQHLSELKDALDARFPRWQLE